MRFASLRSYLKQAIQPRIQAGCHSDLCPSLPWKFFSPKYDTIMTENYYFHSQFFSFAHSYHASTFVYRYLPFISEFFIRSACRWLFHLIYHRSQCLVSPEKKILSLFPCATMCIKCYFLRREKSNLHASTSFEILCKSADPDSRIVI